MVGIDRFKMSEQEYKDAMLGLPLVDKQSGHQNSHTIVSSKINKLRDELMASKNQFDYDLIAYI